MINRTYAMWCPNQMTIKLEEIVDMWVGEGRIIFDLQGLKRAKIWNPVAKTEKGLDRKKYNNIKKRTIWIVYVEVMSGLTLVGRASTK